MMLEGLGLEQRRRGNRSEASEALTPRYRHEDRDRLKVFAGEEEAAQRWAQGFSKVSIEAARLLSQRGLESCDGGFRWSADTRLKTRSLSATESQVLSLLEASQSVPKVLVAGSHGMFQFAKGKDQRIEALGPVREING